MGRQVPTRPEFQGGPRRTKNYPSISFPVPDVTLDLPFPHNNTMKMTTDNPTTRHNKRSDDRPRRGFRKTTPQPSTPAANLLMENVKILRRGDLLTAFLPERSDLFSSNNDRETLATRSLAGGDLSLRKELRMAVPGNGKAYASGSYVTSPHPNLVPVPGFLSGAATGGAAIDNCGLQRLSGSV